MQRFLRKIIAITVVVAITVASVPLQGYLGIDFNLDFLDFAISTKAADYTYGDFTYTVSGSTAVLKKYTGLSASVTIPSTLNGYTVTKIGKAAFSNCSHVTNVSIPNTVTHIETRAFEKTGISVLDLPDNLQFLGARIIANTRVSTVSIPKTVTQMHDNDGGNHGAFCDSNVVSVVFENGIGAIPARALHGATKLKSVTIPNSVTVIGHNAFLNCSSLSSVSIPDSVVRIETRAFQATGITVLDLPDKLQYLGARIVADTRVTSLFIPKTVTQMHENDGGNHGALCDSNVVSVVFEDGIGAIPARALHGATKLKSVTIPDSVTVIRHNAFLDCRSLTSITIPDSVVRIETRAFQATGITVLDLPDKLQYLGARVVADTQVSSLFIPKTVTQMHENDGGNHGALCDSNVVSVVFEDGIGAIPTRALHGATKLKSVTIPESVVEIQAYAFADCSSLSSLLIPKSVEKLGTGVFNNCRNLTVCCVLLSNATLYAIENNVPFSPVGAFVDSNKLVLDRNKTDYYADMNAMSANGYVTYTAKYGVKSGHKSSVSDMTVKIFLPADYDLDEASIKLDGTVVNNYTIKDRVLTIPVKKSSGIVKYSLKINSQNAMLSYAALIFKQNGVSTQEIVGVSIEKIEALTINAASITANTTVEVSGVAPSATVVKLYIDDVPAGEITASKSGLWRSSIIIKDPEEYGDYRITAVCDHNGKELKQSVNVAYCSREPEMKGFKLFYNEHDVIKSVDILNTNEIKPKVYFLPGEDFRFELEYENADEIDKLYVVSTRNNTKRYIEAVYDEGLQKFVAEGMFDENDKNYVPGSISVEYTKKTDPVLVGQDVDWDKLAEYLPENAHESLTIEENSELEYSATISLSKLVGEEINNALKTTISVYDEKLGVPLGEWLGQFNMKEELGLLSYVVPGIDDSKYIVNLDPRDPGTWYMLIHDVTNNKYIKMVYTGVIENQDITEFQKQVRISDCASQISTLSTVTGILSKQYQISQDMEALRYEVMSTSYATPEERDLALKRVDDLEYDQTMFMLMTTVLPLIISSPVALGMSMTVPGIILTGMISSLTLIAPMFWEMRTAQIKGEKFNIGWIIDPSGYVYDIHTGKRIEGVRTSIYCVEYDGSEEFWNKKPADNTYGTFWDAFEYNQSNPLYTNADGKYAWDVPEGWWRVKYEKDGYGTVWSEWLPVPPPQTEVNIGMLEEGSAHSYTKKQIKTPTCTAEGVARYTCPCGDSYTAAVPKKAHSYKSAVTKATLTKNGSIVKKCTVCGNVASNTAIKYAKTFKLSATSYTFDGKVKTPTVTVKDTAGKVLKNGTDYSVTYAAGRKNAGTYKVTITMKGNYSGTKTLTFKINPKNISTCTVKLGATSYVYNGKAKTPAVTVKNASGTTLVKGTAYTVTYATGRTNVGTYKVTIKMKGNYTGTKTLTFKINPQAVAIKTLKAGVKSFTVAWAPKTAQVTGYEIQYSTAKTFKNAKTVTVKSNKTKTTTVKKLTAGKKYFVRIRTYKTVNGVKFYSAWSAAKYVKTN